MPVADFSRSSLWATRIGWRTCWNSIPLPFRARPLPKASANGRRKQRKPARSREVLRSTIIDAGIALFSEQGFYGPSIRDIANTAGVALPTLYRLFIDKRDIYESCCRCAFARQGDLMRSVFRPDDPGDVIIFKLTLAGFHLKFHDQTHYRLLNRLFVDHDWHILASEILEFRQSDMILRMASAVRDAGHETPQLRMMIMEGIFTLGRDLPKTWPTLGITPDDLMKFTTAVLAIVFPRIDWDTIAAEHGIGFLQDSIAPTPFNASSPQDQESSVLG